MAAVGDPVPPLRIDAVQRGHVTTMAVLLRDPNPIHFDTAVVRELGMGTAEVNQGPTNVGYIASALMAWASTGPSAVRRLTVRLAGNVFVGDAVTAGGTVTAVTPAEDGGTQATCEVWLRRDAGADLVVGTAEVRLP